MIFFNLNGKFNNLDDFDLIVGNPPWGAKQNLHNEYCKMNDFPCSNKQIAQSFLVRVKDFSNENTNIALIVTSKILYNSTSLNFRKYFLDNFKINQVLEFSPIRKEVFRDVIGPGVILFYNAIKTDKNNLVEHISLKPSKLFYLLSSVVIQKSDIKYISQNDLYIYDWVWKVLVYGNTLDFYLIKKLKNIPTIKHFIDNHSLCSGVGIQESSNPQKDGSMYIGYNFLDVGSSKKNAPKILY